MSSRLSSRAWSSTLRTARLALHNSSHLHPPLTRALSIPFPDIPATPPTSRSASAALEFPPIGSISYDAIPNPLSSPRPTIQKNLPPPPKYHFYGVFSKNNSKVFLCGPDGKLVPDGWWSGGKCGFKGANRKTHEAGYQCAVRAFHRLQQIISEQGRISLAIHFSGFGKGRSAVEGVFLTSEGERIRPLVVEVEDRTNIKIGGTRAKKRRRV